MTNVVLGPRVVGYVRRMVFKIAVRFMYVCTLK